jgi:hypothetical protein
MMCYSSSSYVFRALKNIAGLLNSHGEVAGKYIEKDKDE